MSYEAVPCMFRSSAQNGNGETQYLGLLIRPSASQQNSVHGAPSAPVLGRTNSGPHVATLTHASSSGKMPQPLLVQGVYPQGAPIVVQGENPKVLVPAKVQVRLQQGGDASVAISPTPLATSTFPVASPWPQAASIKTTYAPPVHNAMSSPCNSQPRSLSVSSSSPQLDSSPMSPLPNIMHYQSLPTPSTRIGSQTDSRTTRATASGQWAAPVSDSSTTPDSGIQSVPGSPPSSHPLTPPTMQLEGCDSVCEERYETEDFADMPRLLPADQEETQCSASCMSLRDDVTSAHGSECETAPTPSISITPSMDSKDIVEQLIMLDPEKANAIANLIKRRQSSSKKRSGSKQENAPKRGRPISAAGEDPKISEEEPKSVSRVATRSTSRASHGRPSAVSLTKLEVSPRCGDDTENRAPQEITPVITDQICTVSPSSETCKITSETVEKQMEMRKLYREAIKEMLREQVASLLESTAASFQDMHIGFRERHDRRSSKDRSNIWAVNWDLVKKNRKKDHDRKRVGDRSGRRKETILKNMEKDSTKQEPFEKCESEESYRVENTHEKRCRKRRNDSTEKENKETGVPSTAPSSAKRAPSCDTARVGKREKEYEEISQSVAIGSLPEWESPVLSCGCTRGACTSDSECVNRALCVQCPTSCTAPLCVNKKFWKDDLTKALVVSGAKTRKILRTRQSRRAGEFLCEFAGDVVSFEDAKQRWETYLRTETSPVILCLTSRLFIDATVRGNVSRFIRQSCKPNARLEVWSVNGNYRAGLFALGEIASGAEVTVDMNGLLPFSKDCNCGVSGCRRRIVMARNSLIASASDLSINEERAVRKDHVFLIRNRQRSIAKAASHGLNGTFEPPNSQIDGMWKVLRGITYRVRRADGRLPLKALCGYHRLCHLLRAVSRNRSRISRTEIASNFDAEMAQWLDRLGDDDIERAYTALRGRYISDTGRSEKDEKPKRDRRKENRFVNQNTNLEYIESKVRVGDYDPDDAWPLGKANEKDDAVRCVCGSLEEDGEMTQCDTCNFWLHSECLSDVDQNTEYKCQFCRGIIFGGRPCGDVILAKQPDIRLRGCTYYKALVNNRAIQVRLNETVHVQKAIRDDHKKILKKLMDLSENTKKSGREERDDDIPLANCEKLPLETFSRKDLRVFRVERLFNAPGGHRFVFGFYYARPHETFCDSQRIFHRNEVFATPLYDTLPLDAVVGRCAVLDPSIWCIGRPTVPQFKEEDVYLCEYQIDRNQRSFEKIPIKNRYPINTQPYVFQKFEKPAIIKRDFTPFVVDPTTSALKSSKVDKVPSNAVDARRIMVQNLATIVEKLNDTGKKEARSRRGEDTETRSRKGS